MTKVPTPAQSKLFMDMFGHRRDAYARHLEPRGWSGPVKDDEDRAFGEGQVSTHLQGYCRLGIYSMKPEPESTCIFVAADFDANPQAFKQAWKLHESFQVEGIFSLVERSYSGKGYHLWIFFDAPVKAQEARTLMFNALIKCKIPLQGPMKKGSSNGRAMDRLFPAQDKVVKGGYGNQIGLPFQGEAWDKDNCVFIDADQNPYPDQWDKLEEAYNNRVPADHPKLKEERMPTAPPIQLKEQKSESIEDERRWFELGKLEGQLERIHGCEAIKASIADPNQFNNTIWTSILCNIAVFGEAGKELAHTVSRRYDCTIIDNDPRKIYSEEETDRAFNNKLDYLQKTGKPTTCKYLEENGWTCPRRKEKTCSFSCIALYDAPPSYSFYSETIPLTAEDREQLYRWEQQKGYEAYLSLFPNLTDFGVVKHDEIKGIKAKEYWIMQHLVGSKQLLVKYPTWDNRVRSIWFEWSTDEEADRFEQHMRQSKYWYEREDKTFWILQAEGEYTLDAARQLIEKIAQSAGIQLRLHWDDSLILAEPHKIAPYFGKWKEYCC